MFVNFFSYIKKSKFISNFKTLSLGILFSQLIIFAAMPILTRLYSPEVFASYALFISLTGIMVHIFTGSYDLAIVTTGKEDDVNYLVTLVLCVSLFFLLIFSFIFYYFDVLLKTKLNAENLNYLWYFIPLLTFFFSIISTIKYYYNRFENYNKINFIFISRSLIFVFFSLFLFFFENINVLIVSEFISLIFLFFFFIFFFSKYFKFQLKKLFLTALEYKDFFFKNSFVNSINSIMTNLPVIFLTIHYDLKYTAFYALCSRVVFTPLSFVSQSLSYIHLKKITDLINCNKNAILYLIKITFILIGFITIPTMVLFFFSEFIFSYLFGESWLEAGQMMSLLIFAFGLQFVVSTLSQVFAPTGNLNLSFFWKVLSFIIMFFFFYFFSGKLEIFKLINYFVILNIILYCLYYLLIFLAVKNPK